MQALRFISKQHWLLRLLLFWSMSAFVAFAVMLTHQSDEPVLWGRYSSLVAVTIIGLFAAAMAALGAWWKLRSRPLLIEQILIQLAQLRQKPYFVPGVIILGGSAIGFVWLFFLGNHILAYGFLRAFICLSIFIATLTLAYGGAVNSQPVRFTYLPLSGLAILLVIALLTISFYPSLLKADEAFDFSMARNALENGHVGPFIYRHAFPADYFGGLWTWVMAGWLKISGLSLTAGRLYVLFISCLSLCFIWAGTARLYDRRTAWYAALLGAYGFISLNHMRYHIHAAFWLSIAIFFYSLTKKDNRWWAHLLAGFTIGMAVDSDPIAYCFGLGLALIYLVDYVQLIWSERRWFWLPFWLIVIGGAAALAVYVALHSGDSFTRNNTVGSMLTFYGGNILQGLASGVFIQLTQQYFTAFFTAQPMLFGFLVIGFITAFWKRTRADRFLLILCITWTVVIIFAYIYFPFFYLVLALPLYVILAARGLALGLPALLNQISEYSSPLARSISMLLIVWLLASVVKDIHDLSSNSLEDVVEVGRAVGQILPQDALIVGAEPYYFGLLDHPRFVGGVIEAFMISFKGMSAQEVWTLLKPDAIIFSQNWSTEPARTPALVNYMEHQHFSMLRCYLTQSFGKIELWVKDIPDGLQASEECISICVSRLGFNSCSMN